MLARMFESAGLTPLATYLNNCVDTQLSSTSTWSTQVGMWICLAHWLMQLNDDLRLLHDPFSYFSWLLET